MSTRQHYLFVVLLLAMWAKSKTSMAVDFNDTTEDNKSCCSAITLGCVVDGTNRVGKEQKIAIELAVHDHIINTSSSSNCDRLGLVMEESEGSPFRATDSAIDLMRSKHVQAIISTSTFQAELTYHNADEKFPFISLNSPAIPSPTPMPFLFQMANDAVLQAQCIAAIVEHFKWRKVTAIYEHNFNGFSAITLTLLSDSLRSVNSEIKHHNAFPSISSLSHPEKAVEKELQKLKSNTNRVFIVFQFSLPSVLMLFEKAKQMGMMEKGYVWIISDEIASLLDSINSSFKRENMQGVIGIKTSFVDSSKAFKQFKRRFKRIYESRYPDEEEENSSPSIFALRAYDSITAFAKAVQTSQGKKITAKMLSENLSLVNFNGLSGSIGFKNGMVAQSPTFEVINVDGKSYREIAFWSKQQGLSKNKDRTNDTYEGIGLVHWPGGTVQTVPPSKRLSEEVEKPLRIAVPAMGLFHEFVRMRNDQVDNKTSVTGFSINVFKAAVKRLPYPLPYEFVPFYGTYDDMIIQVYNKAFDGAVGDIQIYAHRFQYVEFTQPYINSGLEMIVTVESDQAKERWMFKSVFSKTMWILLAAMHFFHCSVVYLIERQYLGVQTRDAGPSLWFSILLFSLKEPLKSNIARFVFAPWMLVILMVMASFTASLSSMLTVSQIKPSILNIETLKRTNATVGCDGNSFIVHYLVSTLYFKPENIMNFTSVNDYPDAFKKGDIKAAFFVAPHAMVFLANNCKGFIRSATWKLGGFGFVFHKESPLAIDISKAVIEIRENKEVDELETALLSSLNNCSSLSNLGSGPIGPQPFSILLIVAATISAFALLVSVARLLAAGRPWRRRIWGRRTRTYCSQASRSIELPLHLHT